VGVKARMQTLQLSYYWPSVKFCKTTQSATACSSFLGRDVPHLPQ